MDTSEQIIQYITQNGQASALELSEHLGISRRGVAKQLLKLTVSGRLVKAGKHPDIIYSPGQGKPAVAQPIPQVATATPEVVIITKTPQIKTVKTASQIQPLGQELLPNWCQKFNIDPTVVTARYEAVRGFVPGLSPRGRNSAKKKLLAALYSGIVLALVFLSVWVQKTGRWSPILKIVGLILILGLIYMVIFHSHRFTPHQNQLIKLQEQLSTSQEENSKLKDQLTDSQNELSKTKDQLADSQSQLSQVKEQLTQEQEQRSSLEQQLKAKEEEIQSLQQKAQANPQESAQKDSQQGTLQKIKGFITNMGGL